MVAIMLAVLAGMTATAVDLGAFMADRRDLQNAADAVALAASLDLPDEDAAIAGAQQWAVNNGIDTDSMTVTIIPQNLPDEPNPKVRVELERDHTFVVAPLIGISSADVKASATAVRTSPGGVGGLMPWSVKDSVQNAAVPNQSLVLKYDANDVETGNFGALRIDGNGASVYRDTIEFGSETWLCASGVSGCPYPSQVQTEPGNMTGPTRTGTDYRMEHTTDACDSWLDVVTVANGKTGLKPECNPFVEGGNPASLRVIIVPVINSLCNGNCTVTVLEFALFFLEGYGPEGCTGNDCEIRGRFIDSNTNFGATMGTYDPDSFAHYVRLVN